MDGPPVLLIRWAELFFSFPADESAPSHSQEGLKKAELDRCSLFTEVGALLLDRVVIRSGSWLVSMINALNPKGLLHPFHQLFKAGELKGEIAPEAR